MKATLNGKTDQTLETAMIPAAIIGVIEAVSPSAKKYIL